MIDLLPTSPLSRLRPSLAQINNLDIAEINRMVRSEPTRKLPLGKSAYDVYGDFLEVIVKAAKASLREDGVACIDDLDRAGKVIYMIAVPIAWCSELIDPSGVATQFLHLISDGLSLRT